MDKMSKDELRKAKIRRKGFSFLKPTLLTPEECFPVQSDNEKVEAMFNKYGGGSAYKVKKDDK